VSTELTIHTGFAGSETTIHVDWFDENNVKIHNTIDLVVLDQDKPRTIVILLDGVQIAVLSSRDLNRGA
jgi:hypothetical protein